MMVVEDTLQDARFIHSQFVEGPPHVRFYAGGCSAGQPRCAAR